MSTKLGNICIFQSGGTPSKGNPDYFGGDIPWITTTALNGSTIDEQNAVDWITEKARGFQKKKSTLASLTMLKPLTVWITTSCGKLLKRWEYQTTLPAS